MSVYHLQLFSL